MLMPRIHVIAVVLLSLGAAPLLAAQKEQRKQAEFWGEAKIHEIHLRVSAQQWQLLMPYRSRGGMVSRVSASQMPPPATRPVFPPPPMTRPSGLATAPATKPAYVEGERLEPNFYGMQFSYVKAQFECDGVPLRDVGLRMRGNSSYNWSGNGYKRPFKIDFNRFVEGQHFLGMSGFILNNNAYDPTQLRELLGYEIFRNLGVHAPRTAFAIVYLTIDGQIERQCIGLYTLIEEVDSKDFLKDHFGSAKGALLKPWSIRGWPYLGEDWSNYLTRYNPESDITWKEQRRVVELIKLVNYADDATFAAHIDSYLNVDSFLRLLGGQVLISSLDNFLWTGHNYYLYLNPKDDRFYLMPWDQNLAFANYTSVGSTEQLVHLSVFHPHMGEMKVIDRLLAIPRYREAYERILKEGMAGPMNPKNVFSRIEALEAKLAEAERMLDAAWEARYTQNGTTRPATIPPRPKHPTSAWRDLPAIALRDFVTRRIGAINTQLAGQSDGFSPGQRRAPNLPPGGLRAARTFGDLPTLTTALMSGADTDCDMKLTRAEAEAALKAFFTEADPKSGGAIDRMQLSVALTRHMSSIRFDGRRPEGRSIFGSRTPNRPSDWAPQWASAVLAQAAAEKSNSISLAQIQEAANKAFVQADKDASGKVDLDEMLMALDALAAPKQAAP